MGAVVGVVVGIVVGVGAVVGAVVGVVDRVGAVKTMRTLQPFSSTS